MNLCGEVWIDEMYNYMCLFGFWATAMPRMAMIERIAGWRGLGVNRWSGGLVEM